MPATRCKVLCTGTAESVVSGAEEQTAYFQAVVGDGSPENAAFFAATPALSLSVSVIKNRPFEAGKQYYLDFTEVTDAKVVPPAPAPVVEPSPADPDFDPSHSPAAG